MPSIQSKIINVLLHVIGMKKTINRLQDRVESGERTYTEPSRRLQRKHLITTRQVNGHKVWTIAPRQNVGNKHIIYLHGGAYVNSFSPQHWGFMSKLVDALNCTVTAPNYPHAPEYFVHRRFCAVTPSLYRTCRRRRQFQCRANG